MSTPQFGRKVSLIIGHNTGDAIDLSELSFEFTVKRGDNETPNSAHIRVYSVSDNTANKSMKEFDRVVLQAGYEGNYGIIFDGTIMQVRKGRANQTDTYLDITAGDGDAAYCFAPMNVTLAAGSTPNDHVEQALKAMEPFGIQKGYIADLPDRPLPRGKVFFGPVRAFLRDIAINAQMVWSIQDGKLQMVPQTSYKPGEIPEITSATGMIGVPEQMQNGIKVKMLLNPSIKIGQLIHINNKSIQRYEYGLSVSQQKDNVLFKLENKLDSDGYYYCMWVEHYGETRGNDWYSEAVCLAVDATVPAEFKNNKVVPPPNVIKQFG